MDGYAGHAHAAIPEAGRKERLLGALCALYLIAAPLLFLPGLPTALGDLRSIVPALVAILLGAYWGISVLRMRRAKLPYVRPLVFFYLLPIAAALSALGSLSPRLSLIGFNGETGTVLAWAAVALAAGASFTLLSERRRALILLAGVALSSALVATTSLAVVAARALFAHQGTVLAAESDAAFFAGLGVVLTISLLSLLPLRRGGAVLVFLGALCLAFLGASGDWGPRIGACAALALLLMLLSGEQNGRRASRLMMPLLFLAIGIALLFSSFWLPQVLLSRESPSITEVGLMEGTMLVQNPVRFMFGTGPNTYSFAWNRYAPANETGTVYDEGIGLYDTMLATAGLIGFGALALFVLAFAAAGPAVFAGDSFIGKISYLGAAYGWATSLMLVPSSIALAILAALSALALASTPPQPRSRLWRGSAAKWIGIGLLMLAGAAAVFLFLQERAVLDYEESISSLIRTSNLDESQYLLANAIQLLPQPVYYRALAEIQERRILVLLTVPQPDPAAKDAAAAEVAAFSKGAIGNATLATKAEPNNYLNWIVLGDVYGELAMAGVSGASAQAAAAYERAASFAPNNPLPITLEADLLIKLGNTAGGRALLMRAQDMSPKFSVPQSLETSISNAR